MKVNIANQNTGVISTPNAGGIFPLASLNNGSDGHATTAQGKSLRFVSGYQDETTRQSMAKDMKFKNGPNTVAVGCTHASVSASKNSLPDDNVVPNVSEREETTDTSIIDKMVLVQVILSVVVDKPGVEEIGTTKAETPFIVIVIAIIIVQKKIMVLIRRHIMLLMLVEQV